MTFLSPSLQLSGSTGLSARKRLHSFLANCACQPTVRLYQRQSFGITRGIIRTCDYVRSPGVYILNFSFPGGDTKYSMSQSGILTSSQNCDQKLMWKLIWHQWNVLANVTSTFVTICMKSSPEFSVNALIASQQSFYGNSPYLNFIIKWLPYHSWMAQCVQNGWQGRIYVRIMDEQ